MNNFKFIIYFIFALIPLRNICAQVTSIIDLKQNDENGIPVYIGNTYTITGIVTSSNQFGTSGPASIEDNTSGISIYGDKFALFVAIGDSVTVTGPLTHFNGLTQIDFNNGGTFTKNSYGKEISPIQLTINQILSQEWNGSEDFESRLIRINGVNFNQTGSFSSSTNYTIMDNTGSMEMRVDNNVASLIGKPIPVGEIDLIGILGQYKTTAPYNSGYQILPRNFDDLILGDEPLILNHVVAGNITTNSFTVYFSTFRPGNSIVKYGLTEQLEMDSVLIEKDTVFHKVLIEGLSSATKYYYQAVSENQSGRSESSVLSTFTTDINEQESEINIYFNGSVDNSVAIPGNEAIGNIDFRTKLLERINQAEYSIDIAIYSFNGLNDLANALIAAKNRGVKVRIVYDSRNIQSTVQSLIDAGIKISQRPQMNGIMHNKFVLFDVRDSIETNSILWTGSFNWTTTELSWKNNVVEIKNELLCKNYLIEFEEMWGSNNDSPSTINSRFGPYKTDNTQHIFNIGGIRLESYFSPSDDTENLIANKIATSDSSLYFALLTFTSDPIFNSIQNLFGTNDKDSRGIIDNVNDNGSEYSKLLSFSEVYDYNLSGTLHHKYGIIDASFISSDPIVITGSHNWSNAANTVNDENTLIIHDYLIANKFLQEFKARYNELGGTGSFFVPVISDMNDKLINLPNEIVLYQNYPNPFNPMTTLSFYLDRNSKIDFSVYNILGENVHTFIDGKAEKGKYVFDFKDESLSSGIYFYVLKTDYTILSGKMILLK